MHLDKYVIIVAGGSGQRMGSDIPKQLLEIGGKPMLRHTIELFTSMDKSIKIILVMNSVAIPLWKDYCRKSEFFFPHILVKGGLTRFHSVKNGLSYVEEGSLVAVHDAVRPFVPINMLKDMFAKAEKHKALLPILPVADSMREKVNEKFSQVDRERFILVQTPQIFDSKILKDAYNQPYNTTFTDDGSVVEASGVELSYCEGYKYNIKITTPDDLQMAEILINSVLVQGNL